MQTAPPQEQAQYAGLGLRVAAVAVDSFVLLVIFLVVGTIWAYSLVMEKGVDPQDTIAVQTLLNEQVQDVSSLTFYLVLFGSLFIYYLLLEAIFHASVGKLVLGMRVVMLDGSRATGLAVVLRNLIRIPEAMFLYVPAGLSCLASPRRQRLGDHAARTVVVRRPARAAVAYQVPGRMQPFGQAPAAPPAAGRAACPPPPPPVSPGTAWPAPPDPPVLQTLEPAAVDAALARLKTAALAVRGAHLTYLTFSERELAAGGGEQTGGYSEAYVSAWFTLTDAVAALKEAHASLEAAAAAAGFTPDQALAAHPDLLHVLGRLGPYFGAADDDSVHAAFLAVARAEATPS
jgi:uncharacterized RDD family membrane protein YckC